jgi:hypothetical protein
MKLAIVFSLTIAGAVGALASPAGGTLARPLDAQPEGLIAGAGLLMLAWLLRQGLPHKDAK